MRLFDAPLGAALAWAGWLAASSAAPGGDPIEPQAFAAKALVALVGTGGVGGGLWLMAKTIFARQERRIDFLEEQNAAQQKLIDAAHLEHAGCRESLARHEERLKSLGEELAHFRAGK